MNIGSRNCALAALAIFSLVAASKFAEAKTIKVGVLTDLSGPYADNTGPGAVLAAEIAAEEAGEVLGHKVEVISADHQDKPDVGAAIANRWLDQEGVDVIADVPVSSIALAVQDIVRRKRGIDILSGPAAVALVREACSPYGFLWTYSTFTQAHGVGDAVVDQGGDTWFFVQADYAFGAAMAADLRQTVEAKGGKVLGVAKHPQGTSDFSSYLLTAQASGAKVVALLNAGQDTDNAIKQANEFGLIAGGQRLAAFIFLEPNAKALGLSIAKSLTIMNGFYWQQSATAEAWSRKFFARFGRMPTAGQIGVYSGVLHYLKAVKAVGSDDRDAIVRKMRELPVEDAFVPHGIVRADGVMIHDMLLEQVKTPAESKEEWDVFKILKRVGGEAAFGPIQGCPPAK
jgi:branched-chain amino acid transport system substrate-binding protein